MISLLRTGPFLLASLLLSVTLPAQTATATADSVIVTGRINHLSARLYRDQPTVLVSRTNILQASRELVRSAPLAIDGTFRVALPLIYPQEELFFNYGRITTPFLAAPGTLRIDLDADSLFTATVPFRFGGVNAQINNQFAQFKAFEAGLKNKPNPEKLADQAVLMGGGATYAMVRSAYETPFRQFADRQKPFPLLSRWMESINRYVAAGFVYDKAINQSAMIPKALDDTLRPPGDRILTTARAAALSQFSDYVLNVVGPSARQSTSSISVPTLSSLLLRYGKNLTEEEQTRLQGFVSQNTASQADLRFFDRLVRRSNDTIQRLAQYETIIRTSRSGLRAVDLDYVIARTLAVNLSDITLDFARLFYDYARPQIKDAFIGQSLDELYGLEVKDSTRIRAARQRFRQAGTTATEISPGVFVTRDATTSGKALLERVLASNRGKVIYVLMASPHEEAERQATLAVQQLRSRYSVRDLAFVYVPATSQNADLWIEQAAKYTLSGDHVLATAQQLSDIVQQLRPGESLSATIINRVGKIVKRNAPLPDAPDELRKVLARSL